MDKKDKQRYEELQAKFNNGEEVTVEEKAEFDELGERFNQAGGNPKVTPQDEDTDK